MKFLPIHTKFPKISILTQHKLLLSLSQICNMTKCVHNKCSHPQVVWNRSFCLNRCNEEINYYTRIHTIDVNGPLKTRVPKHKLVHRYSFPDKGNPKCRHFIGFEMNINELRAHDVFIYIVLRYKYNIF